ncbi:protein FATTY ACID EXPORT 7-like [Punica granatum]|uniref:Protein FATTY ACID EXPORT 7-like n=1 Tax=Punica granatum TaxID=22663 RepID=A0A6P8C9J5_PUNGR|nr:protein FATTY ACID EXPORT 7-like [Punica granatum]
MEMPTSQKLTLGYATLVGVGGVMGHLKSGSQKSLVAGGKSASLLYVVYTQLPSALGYHFEIERVSGALVGVMGLRYKRTGKVVPAGAVSLVLLVMAGGYLHGITRSLH